MYTGSIQYITGKQVWWNPYRTWVTPETEVVLEAAGVQPAAMYTGHSQGTLDQWVALQTIFEVYAREWGYKGVGRQSIPSCSKSYCK